MDHVTPPTTPSSAQPAMTKQEIGKPRYLPPMKSPLTKTAWPGPLVYHTVEQIDHVATGAAMRQLRVAHGITLRDIARRMELSAPFISDLERGRRNWTGQLAIEYMTAETAAFVARIQKAQADARKTVLKID